MKKTEYIVPEMEVLELKYCKILCNSGDEPAWDDDPADPDDDDDLPD